MGEQKLFEKTTAEEDPSLKFKSPIKEKYEEKMPEIKRNVKKTTILLPLALVILVVIIIITAVVLLT